MCDNFSFFFFSFLQIHAANDLGILFKMFLLDLLKRTYIEFDRANVSVLKADCAAADFTETAPFEEETSRNNVASFFSQ